MPSRRMLAGVLVALIVALAWRLGERRGLERGATRAADARVGEIRASGDPGGAPSELPPRSTGGAPGVAANRSPAGLPTTGGDGDEETLAALIGEREMLRETVRSLRMELERIDRLSAAERAELELYRRIGADEMAKGLAIDTIERRRGDPATGDPATLRVTLVQVRGRDRVAGSVEIVPLEADAPDLPPESSGEVRAALAAEQAPVATWSAPFDLRFFETLEIPLGERFPEVIEIRVLPDGKPHAPFRSRHRREAIRIVD